MTDLLLEIGCENLPAAYVPPAIEQLRIDAAVLLGQARLGFESIQASGTARRLVLQVRALASRQETRIDTVTGPPLSKSFDADGRPTQAALGFARAQGLEVGRLETFQTPRGEYVGFKKKLPGRRTTVLLKTLLPELIAGLKFPKTMRWLAGGTRFARPIRWIVCLYGERVVRFEFAGVHSGGLTYRTPWIHPKGMPAGRPADYATVMKKAGIIVDPGERQARIEKLAAEAAAGLGLKLVDDPELFREITFMVEDPHVFVGDFPEKYLSLPSEIVKTAMKAHQRYLAVEGPRRELMPKFVAFRDGRLEGKAGIRKGNERVLRARLEDALFYWQEDLKLGINGLAAKLGSIVFIEKLGSLGQKSERVKRLMHFINDSAPESQRLPGRLVDRTAEIAKADLASEMIKDGKEFTLLEGIMGSRYAEASGEDPAVVLALQDQYRPRVPADLLPEHLLGLVLGIADRMDTIGGCFLAGLTPTGAGDPYGLRRQSNGLLRILEKQPLTQLDHLVELALDGYMAQGLVDESTAGEVRGRLEEFLTVRIEAFLIDRKFSYDIVRAVSRVAWARPAEAVRRCQGFQAIRGDEAFERLLIGVKRVGNILGPERKIYGSGWKPLERALLASGELAPGIRFSADSFVEPMENRLLEAVRDRIAKVAGRDQQGDFSGILRTLATLGPVIADFFDTVLVNCEDTTIRNNRINFLAAIFALFSKYADFSEIVEINSPTS